MFGSSVRLNLELLSARNAPSTLPGTTDPLVPDPTTPSGTIPAYVGLPPVNPNPPGLPDPPPVPPPTPTPEPELPVIVNFKYTQNQLMVGTWDGWVDCEDPGQAKVYAFGNAAVMHDVWLTPDNNGYFMARQDVVFPRDAGRYDVYGKDKNGVEGWSEKVEVAG